MSARQDLADFILRQLGSPVIVIEVDSQQLEDNIDLAVQYYHEYHFDGIERDYLSYIIVGTKITVADATGFTKGGAVMSLDGATVALISNVTGNVITINKQVGLVKFSVGQTISTGNSGGAQTTISGIVLGDPDNGWIPVADEIVGVKKILNITSILGSSDYMFNVNYQIMMSEIQNLTSAGTAYFYGVQQFLGHLDFIMKKEKDFRFNRRMNRLYLDIAWTQDVKVGDVVIAEVYRALDEVNFPKILDDIWLKRYATALVKKQWGSNTRKYQGMQLPGGVTFNGQTIYDEAVEEVKYLEGEAIYSTSPLEFMTG
jgi:hypothetical protein